MLTLPFVLRLLIIFFPVLDLSRAKKPCLRFRTRCDGSYVSLFAPLTSNSGPGPLWSGNVLDVVCDCVERAERTGEVEDSSREETSRGRMVVERVRERDCDGLEGLVRPNGFGVVKVADLEMGEGAVFGRALRTADRVESGEGRARREQRRHSIVCLRLSLCASCVSLW